MRFNTNLEQIKVYDPGKPIDLVVREYGVKPENVVKLASNENPFGAPPKAIKAIQENAHQMFRYPDDSMLELKQALADRFKVQKQNILLGAGSDQVIDIAMRAKCNAGDKILIARTTFAMYEIYARQLGLQILKTPSHEHVLDEFIELYNREKPELVFLCVPNNPMGECLDFSEVRQFLDLVDDETLVILDGAYQEYAQIRDSKKAIPVDEVIAAYPNVLYMGTFSKAFGLGGMRVGYGIAPEPIMQAMYKMRSPFNVTALSLIAANAALEDEVHVRESIEDCFREVKRYEQFAKDEGCGFVESYTNFITLLLSDSIDSKVLSQWMLEQGVIVRNMSMYGLNAIRVTIGKDAENDRFFETFKAYTTKA